MRQSKKNFILGVLGEGFWGLGVGLIAPDKILSLALVDLGYSTTAVAFMIAFFFAGMSFPQVFSALLLPPRFTHPKVVAWLHAPAIVGPLVAGLGFALVPENLNHWRLIFLFGGFILHSFGIGVAVPFWIASVGRCVSERTRGRFFGLCFFAAGLTSSLTGWLAARWAAQGGLHWGYALCFCLAVPCFILAMLTYGRLKPLHPAPHSVPPNAVRSNLLSFIKKLGTWRPFQVALLLTLLMIVVGTPANLFTVYLREQIKVDISWFQFFNPASSIGAMAGAYLLGHLIDHKSMRSALWSGFGVALASLGFISFFPQPPYSVLAYACAGFFGGFGPVGSLTMLLNLTEKKESTVRIGLFNTLLSPFQFLAPLAFGWLAVRAGYGWIFLTASICCLIAFWALAVKAPFEKMKKS